MGRIDAAIEESSGRSAVPPDELADLAAAIQRIESVITEGPAQQPDSSAAVERVADIAFTPNEREVESSLGEELNAAVREINDLGGLKQLSPERAQQAAELLRQLSRRVHDMIAQSKVDQGSGPAWKKTQFVIADGDDEEYDALNDGSFKTDVPEDDEFALVVAALTAALPSLPEFSEPVPVPPPALARGDAAPLADDALLADLSIEAGDEARTVESESASPPAEASGETVIVIDSSSSVLLDDQVLPPTPSNKEEASHGESSAGDPPTDPLSDTLLEDLLRDAVQGIPSEGESSQAVAALSPASEAPAEDLADDPLLALPSPEAPDERTHEASAVDPSETQLPREAEEQKAADAGVPMAAEPASPSSEDLSSFSALPLVTPDDDPGDLFDLTLPVPSTAAPRPEPVAPTERALEPAQEFPESVAASLPDPSPQIPSRPPSPQSRVAAAPQPVPRLAPNDPLGPVRALSEEETIALFS
jgi:hypothetical protein